VFASDISEEEVRAALAQVIAISCARCEANGISRSRQNGRGVLVCGVNGVGKTTRSARFAYEL